MSRLAHLAMYAEASTNNPLGQRPFGFWLQSPAWAPRSAPMMSGYYPSEFYVPTPGNIVMQPTANVLGYMGQDSLFSDPTTYLLAGGAALALWYFLRKKRR